MDINVLISNPDYFSELLPMEQVAGIYVEQERTAPDRLRRMVRSAHQNAKKLYLALPYIWNEESAIALKKEITSIVGAQADGYLVRNLDELGFLSDRGIQGEIILDAGLYTWNKRAMACLGAAGGTRFTAPYELNRREIDERGWDRTELVIYGHYPMMISSGCLRLTTGKCVKDREPYGVYKLRDRTGATFPVVNCCRYCMNIIYNSVPTWLLDEPGIEDAQSVRLSFTTESRLEMRSILTRFFDGETAPKGSVTRGHYKRGAQ